MKRIYCIIAMFVCISACGIVKRMDLMEEGLLKYRPSILFIAEDEPGNALKKSGLRKSLILLAKKGFCVDFRNFDELDNEDFSLDKYHAVVLLVSPNTTSALDEVFEELSSEIGLLIVPGWVEHSVRSLDEYSKNNGMEFRMIDAVPVKSSNADEERFDDKTSYNLLFNYLYIDKDKDHPVLKDVNGLWVPIRRDADEMIEGRPNSVAFDVGLSDQDKGWETLISYDDNVELGYRDLGTNNPPSEYKPVRVLAVLPENSPVRVGRTAILGVPSPFHLYGGALPGNDGGFFGDLNRDENTVTHDKLTSDGLQLIVNLLAWLSEPRTIDQAGCVDTEWSTPPADLAFKILDIPPEKPHENRTPLKGIIGALTINSGGKSSIKQYADEARNSGFDFLVVLEDINALAEKYPDCMGMQEQTFNITKELALEETNAPDSNLIVVPGLRFMDETGNRFVAFGQELKYPEKTHLTRDMKFKTVTGDRLGITDWIIDNRVENKIYLIHYREQRIIPTDGSPMEGSPIWDVRSFVRHVAIQTFVKSGLLPSHFRLVDNILPSRDGTDAGPDNSFLQLVDDGQNLSPVALTFLTECSDIQLIKNGTSDTANSRQTYPHTVWLKQFREEMLGPYEGKTIEYRDPGTNSFFCGGPTISCWYARNTATNQAGNYWHWSRYFHRWRLEITSSQGPLEYVQIWDGDDLLYEWSPGTKTFEKDVFLTLHRQFHPVILARDQRGVTVTGSFNLRQNNFKSQWNSDRLNTISSQMMRDKGSPSGTTIGNSPFMGQTKGGLRRDPLFLSKYGSKYKLPLFDGELPSVNIKPDFRIQDDNNSDAPYARHITAPLIGHEVIIREAVVNYGAPINSDYLLLWGNNALPKLGLPEKLEEGRLRYTVFQHYPDDPGVVLVEGKATFKCEMTPDPENVTPLFRALFVNKVNHFDEVLISSTGEDEPTVIKISDLSTTAEFQKRMANGDYMWLSPSPTGSAGIIMLNPGEGPNDMTLKWVSNTFMFLFDDIPDEDQSMKPYQAIQWSYLVITGRDMGGNASVDEEGTSEPEQIINRMGILEDHAVEVVTNDDGGELLESNYILKFRPGQEGAGFYGTLMLPEGNLPVALPLQINELKPRRTAVLWDETEQEVRPIAVEHVRDGDYWGRRAGTGVAYAHYNPRDFSENGAHSSHTIFIGHPFIFVNQGPDPFALKKVEELRLTVVQEGDKCISIRVHNPTEHEFERITLRKARHFNGYGLGEINDMVINNLKPYSDAETIYLPKKVEPASCWSVPD
ncbi:MAG: hypothetical protein SWO11_22430 [Thermodesulfobacteriota bacterium]|nr:hypothetical protein [Thermodesulfobacteriota bacterium]